jgi:hypothetical protein
VPGPGNGWGAYVQSDVAQNIHFDGEYASWQDGVNGTSDNGWQVNFNVNLGAMTGWGNNLSLQVGYLSYGANFYPPYGAAEADIFGNMNDSLYPGNAQGFLGLLSFSPIQNWTVYVSYFTGNAVSPSPSLVSYAIGLRYVFSTRATLGLYTRDVKIANQEQTLVYRAQLDYNF